MRVLIPAVLLALSGASLKAQDAPSPIILSLPVTARSAGLGGAGVALSGDAGSVFLNPAGLATIRYAALEGALQRYPDGTAEGMVAGAFRFLQFDFGGGIHYLRFNDTSAVADNFVWSGAGVYRLGLFALGSSLKYVSLEDSSGHIRRSATMDAGLGIHVFDLMTFAFSVRNVGDWEVTGGPLELPISKHAAFSFNFVDPQLTARLLGTVEVVWTERANRRTIIGLEGGAVLGKVGLVARLGYGAQPQQSGQEDFSFGGGLVLSRFTIDYAWQKRTTLGDHIHRFGLRLTL